MSGEINTCQLLRLGIDDQLDLAGDYEFMLKQNRLNPELMAEDILKNL